MHLPNAIARLFRRRRIEAEMDEEMQFHLEQLTQRHRDRGLSPAAARRAALQEFGGVDQSKEAVRDAWGLRVLLDLGRDLRHAARSLRRTPGFAAIAIVTLALGIGVNAVMFSFVRDSVLRPLMRNHQLNLASIYTHRADADLGWRVFAYDEWQQLRAQTEVFADTAAYAFDILAIGQGRHLSRRAVGMVSDNFFELLNTRPFAGRFFTPAECQPGAAPAVAVADYGFWERAGKPAGFIGSTVRVEQRDVTIIGIAPRGFIGLHASIGPDLWLPLGEMHPITGADLRDPGNHRLSAVARLAPGLDLAAANARLPSLARTLWGDLTTGNTDDVERRVLLLARPSTTDLQDDTPADEGYLGVFATLSMGLSFVVLVVACLNLANLLLARGATRRKEIAVRLSLGASRGRILRQLGTEGLLLALLGGGLGLLLSVWADHALISLAAETFAVSKFSFNVAPFLDGSIVLITLGFCIVATVLSSLGPALRITRPNLIEDIKRPAGAAAATGRRFGRLSLPNFLVVLQVAFSLALLFSATLFVGSARHARVADRGFSTAGQAVAQLDYELTELEPAQIDARQRELLTRLADTFPAESLAAATSIPYNFDLSRRSVYPPDAIANADPDTGEPRHARPGFTAVSEHYFDLLQLTLLRGRTFNHHESTAPDGPRVIVIDQRLATTLFGDADPIGQHVYLSKDEVRAGDPQQAYEIIGVVNSPREQVFSEPPLRIYRPLVQVHAPSLFIHLGSPDPVAVLPRLRSALTELEPGTPILLVRTLASFVDQNVNTLVVELCGMVFGAFGVIALILAVAGVYGVKSHHVAQRTREIGIRLAIGASPRRVVRQILRQGLGLGAIGLVLGVALAGAAGKVLSSMLLQADAGQGIALLGSAVALAAAVFLACWIPARRAARVDPAVTLKAE